MGVKARGDQQELRGETPCHRLDNVEKRTNVLRVSVTGGERQVQGESLAFAAADLTRRAGAWIEGVLMRGYEQYVRVAVERVLRSVAVVDVPVHHQHSLEPMCRAQVRRGERHVVEQAKAHGAIPLRMMSGRPYEREPVRHLAGHHGVDQGQHAARGAARRFERS